MLNDIDIDVEQFIRDDMLDLNSLGKEAVASLKTYRDARLGMIKKREALKKGIKIIDKRIEITLSTIKTLQTPS